MLLTPRTDPYGRFVSVDPLGGSVSDPQSLNAYAYVGNGPLSATDSSGMSIDDPVGNIWLIYSGASAANGGPAIWSFSRGPFNFHFSAANSILQPGAGVGGSFALCGLIARCGGSFDKGPPLPTIAQVNAERGLGSVAMGGAKELYNTVISITPGCGFSLIQLPYICDRLEARNSGEKLGSRIVFGATFLIPGEGEETGMTKLLAKITSKGRTIVFAEAGSTELRYLEHWKAEANCGGPGCLHILLGPNASKEAVLEEFLHGTQSRLGIIERLGIEGAEAHVKDFMFRHRKLLGLF